MQVISTQTDKMKKLINTDFFKQIIILSDDSVDAFMRFGHRLKQLNDTKPSCDNVGRFLFKPTQRPKSSIPTKAIEILDGDEFWLRMVEMNNVGNHCLNRYRNRYKPVIEYLLVVMAREYRALNSKYLKILFAKRNYRTIIDLLIEFNLITPKTTINDYKSNPGEYSETYISKQFADELSQKKGIRVEPTSKQFKINPSIQEFTEIELDWGKINPEKIKKAHDQLDGKTQKQLEAHLSQLVFEPTAELNEVLKQNDRADKITDIEQIKEIVANPVVNSDIYHRRYYNNITRLPKVARKLIKTKDGNRLHEIDMKSCMPFTHIATMPDGLEKEMLTFIYKEEDLYEGFAKYMSADHGKEYTRDDVKDLYGEYTNSRPGYNDAGKFEHSMRERFPEFHAHMRKLKSEGYLKYMFGKWAEPMLTKNGKQDKNINACGYHQYIFEESRIMAGVLDKINDELGSIPLYTVYDCIAVEEQYIETVQQYFAEVTYDLYKTEIKTEVE